MQDTLLEPLCFNHNVFGCLQTCSYPLNTMAQIDMEERKNIPPRVEYRSKWGHPEYMYILNALKGRWCSLVVTRCFDFATVTRCLQALFCQFDLTLEKKTPTSRRCLRSYLANFVCLLLFSAPPLAQLLIGAILVPTLWQKCLFLQQINGSSTPPSSSGLTDCCLIVWYPTDSLLMPPFISHRKGEEHSCTIIIMIIMIIIIIIIHISQ